MQCKDTLLYICLFYSCLVFYFIFSLYIKTNKLFLKMVSLRLSFSLYYLPPRFFFLAPNYSDLLYPTETI